MKRITSWNVNGLRAVLRKGFLGFLKDENADVICLQETKLQEAQLPAGFLDELNTMGYEAFWHSAERKGYSGVAMFTKETPQKVVVGLGDRSLDVEGRFLALEYSDAVVACAYFPHARENLVRLDYKLGFNKIFLERIKAMSKPMVCCGDFNVAHKAIDLARPDSNEGKPGFSDEEREWFGSMLSEGFVDAFRDRHPGEPGHYSWWSYRRQARQNNVGWRVDYCVADRKFMEGVSSCEMLSGVMGSDHCPVRLDLG